MPLAGTIIELLTAANPKINLQSQPMGPVIKSALYKPLHDDDVSDWSDFTYDNIKAAYGHLFNIGLFDTNADRDFVQDSPRSSIQKERHVDAVVLLWNYQVCRLPMRHAARRIQNDLGVQEHVLKMKYEGENSKDPESEARARSPDWSVFLLNPESGGNNIVTVWGDSKCSSKWTSDWYRMPQGYENNWIWPFRQVLTYCVNSDTRYGFIVTPEEVVVLRVHEDKSSTPDRPWRVQYAAISWDLSGEGTLTTNLAIWALAMMSLNEEHRRIRTFDQTLPLNIWWIDPGRNWAQHHLSGVKVSKRPEGAEARPRPVATKPQTEVEEDSGPRRSKRLRR